MLDVLFAAYVAVAAVLSLYAVHRLHLIVLLGRARLPPAPPPDGATPIVTVQLPIYNERHVVERLIDAVAGLTWPRDRLEIQVLDDSTDDTVALCAARVALWRARGLSIDHVRRPDRSGFKAGALQHGLASARGELVLVLDADFVPPADFLARMVGAFADPEVGMVQARWDHLNRGSSALTELQALLLDGHFGVEQTARARAGRFFNFNGTAGVWRRRAIDDAGGWHGDTLTEDLDLSYRALLRGWRFVYLPERAVPAELPAAMSGFKSQQFRWAKGSIQVARKLLPAVLRSEHRLAAKIEAVFHLTHNLPYLLTAALALLAVPALVWRDAAGGASAVTAAALALGAPAITGAYLVAAERVVRGSLGIGRVLAVLARVPALMALCAGISLNQSRAVIEGLIGHPSEFLRTPKEGAVGRARGAGSYRAATGWIPLCELGAAVYLGAGLFHAIGSGRLLAAPILAVFTAGFAFVGLGSAASRLRARRA